MTNPLSWSVANRVLLLSAVVAPLTVWYLAVFHFLMHRPDVAPYVDRNVLAIAIDIQTGIVLAWIALMAGTLLMRRRHPDSPLYMHALCAVFAATVAYFAYMIGPFSSMFLPAAFLSGAAAALILLDHRIIAYWQLVVLALAAGMIILEQIDLIPYAPLLLHAPFRDGDLSTSWILTIEAVAFSLLPMFGFILYFLVASWRGREQEIAAAREQLGRANAIISRYVPTQLAAGLLNNDFDATLRHERRKITVFFSDVKGFSEIADRLEPEDLSTLLNEYLSEMTSIADRHGGTLDQYYGDGILIYFGAPVATDDQDHALRAVRMALDMLDRVSELSEKWQRSVLEHPFEIRIGINTGFASIGNYGTAKRMAYMAVGRPVNLAARLQAKCTPGRILISHPTWLLVREHFECEDRGEIEVKGSHFPIRIYEIAGPVAAARDSSAVAKG
jgi:adenylate cyclase